MKSHVGFSISIFRYNLGLFQMSTYPFERCAAKHFGLRVSKWFSVATRHFKVVLENDGRCNKIHKPLLI